MDKSIDCVNHDTDVTLEQQLSFPSFNVHRFITAQLKAIANIV